MVTVNMLLLELGGKFRVLQEKRAGSAKEFALVESGYDKSKTYEKTVVVLRAGELAKVVSDTLFSVIITVGDEDEAAAAKSFLARPAVDSGCCGKRSKCCSTAVHLQRIGTSQNHAVVRG